MTEKIITFEMIFSDSGLGISPENRERIFMNFERLHETQDINKQGVGLGLSICKQIIDAMGGRVDIKSEESRGTEFIIKLQAKCRVDENKLNQARELLENGGKISSTQ